MNDKELRRFEKALHRACKRHLANGGILIRGRFWDGGECRACPIRATAKPIAPKSWLQKMEDKLFGITISPPGKEQMYEDLLTRVLGFEITRQEYGSFIRGYDAAYAGYPPPDSADFLPLYEMGKRFAAIYKPEMVNDGR